MNKRHIPSLSIQNYRSLGNLDIDPLAHVNLIVGPNNIGKSSLLEAILLWGTKRHFLTIRDILRSRKECNPEYPDRFQVSPFLGLYHLFTGFPMLSSDTNPVSISTPDQKIDLQIYDAEPDANSLASGSTVAFNIAGEGSGQSVLFNLGGTLSGSSGDLMEFKHYLDNKCLYISPNMNGAARVPASKLWEQAEFYRQKTAVIDSLRLIESGVEDIFFTDSTPRIPLCHIKGLQRPISLHSMGDGVSRLFELILSIVNVAGGICLIDEFENGLHRSVQELVWDVMFQTAKKLDVQVFATTHSYDTVKAFQTVALRQENENIGEIIQMRKRGGKTIANPIFGEDIWEVQEYEVEVR